MEEHCLRKAGAAGSNPAESILFFLKMQNFMGFLLSPYSADMINTEKFVRKIVPIEFSHILRKDEYFFIETFLCVSQSSVIG